MTPFYFTPRFANDGLEIFGDLKLMVIVIYPPRQNCPKIFHTIQVRRPQWPVQSVHIIVLQLSHDVSTGVDGGIVFFGSAWLFQRRVFCQLLEIFTLLETARIRQGQIRNLLKINKYYSGSIIFVKGSDYMRIQVQSRIQLVMLWVTLLMSQNKSRIRFTKQSFHLFHVLFYVYILDGFMICLASDINRPSMCEVCALLAREMHSSVKGIHSKTEIAFIELTEGICSTMLSYKIHNDRTGLARFSKEESQTMKTLKQLKKRGVKVNLGVPYDMWDQPAAEVTYLKQLCEYIMSEYEDEIEQWFLGGSADPLEVEANGRDKVMRLSSESQTIVDEKYESEMKVQNAPWEPV
uniref:DUF3456 domain-containing protein n=1 Tax=Heterorhabditis bacteriophora TaxID=37862 RepID=A0A1I7XGW4_HETBA